ncbi:MAG TPA: hypothetical protein VGG07_21975 [Solirubrobacteraceae bacterium]|jgi:hypothetical protein|nr:hypothetical protein [Solirubrobacteraceae bacterium]
MFAALPPPASPPTVLVRQAAVGPAAVRPITSILGVLRRRQTTADLAPTLVAQLAVQARSPITTGLEGTPVVSLVRRASTPWGQSIFLTPSLPRTRRQFARLPAKLRGVTVVHQVSIALYPLSTGQITPAVIEAGRGWSSESEHDVDRAGDRFVFLFPDGVAKVALWNARSIAAHPRPLVERHSRPVVASVHDNVAAFESRTFQSPGHEVWYGPTGQVVKRIANASSCAPPLGSCC